MPRKKKIFIITGEPSGDLHASYLAHELIKELPGAEFYGVGGRLLRKEGVTTFYDIAELSVIGVVEVLSKLLKLRTVFRGLLNKADALKPDLAILVDYPGFNLRMAKALKKKGVPIVYFISPQVWAWGENRIQTIKKCVEKIIVFFKFEEELYKRHGVDVAFIGHPLLEMTKPAVDKDTMIERFGLKGKTIIALLPGSRPQEVRKFLPLMLEAGGRISSSLKDVRYLISKPDDVDSAIYRDMMRYYALPARLVEGKSNSMINCADFAIAASGTVTLECAIMGTPLVIIYTSNAVSWILFKSVSRISSVGLANIIAGRKIVPELLQRNATPQKIASVTVDLLRDEKKMSTMIRELAAVKSSLGKPGAYHRAAESVLSVLNRMPS